MRTRLLHILAVAVVALQTSMAAAFSPELDGTMMPYRFSEGDTIVPWSEDLQPVTVNYVARHGARFLSSENKVEHIRKALLKAKQRGELTDKGERFLQLIQRVDSVTAGSWGALNATGIDEEQRLGRQLMSVVPRLMAYGRVTAKATYVPRVVMTMYEFCHSLARGSQRLEISTSEGRQFNSLLRYFSTDSAYVSYLKEGDWKGQFDAFSEANTPVAPAKGMIRGEADRKKLQKVTLEAYGVLQSLRASGIETDAGEWFTEKEYRQCWEVANLKHYYQRSASRLSTIPVEACSKLLNEIVESADSAFMIADLAAGSDGAYPIADSSYPGGFRPVGKNPLRANLWFGHAETVIPLFAAMQLPGCYAPDAAPEEVADVWKDYEVSPLGANLMMVCLRNAIGDHYVALRLNGRWLGPPTPWKNLKTKWLNNKTINTNILWTTKKNQ